jgi:hypothetical protein
MALYRWRHLTAPWVVRMQRLLQQQRQKMLPRRLQQQLWGRLAGVSLPS